MSRRLDELCFAVISNESMFRTTSPVQEHCIGSILVGVQIIQNSWQLGVITTTLVNLKTGICLITTDLFMGFKYLQLYGLVKPQ